jgi:RNA polymerase sigma-70 factor (ECF subfamily)
MPDDADRDLISRILSGGNDGKAAFKDLYDRYQRQVFTLCFRLVGDAHRAADATQESFLAVLKGLGSFGFQSSFRTWLFQVTKNAALQQLRKSTTRSHLSLDETDEKGDQNSESRDVIDPDSPDQLKQVIDGELGSDIQAALSRLKSQHAQILSLRYFGNQSYEELAGILRCSLGTVKSRLNRAHSALKPLLLDLMKKHQLALPGESPDEGWLGETTGLE